MPKFRFEITTSDTMIGEIEADTIEIARLALNASKPMLPDPKATPGVQRVTFVDSAGGSTARVMDPITGEWS